MAAKRRRDGDSRVDAYRRVRKPVPPPSRVERDRRRKLRERQAAKDAEEARTHRTPR